MPWEYDRSISKWKCKNGLRTDLAKGGQWKSFWRLQREIKLQGFTFNFKSLRANLEGHCAPLASGCSVQERNTVLRFRSVRMGLRIFPFGRCFFCFPPCFQPARPMHLFLKTDLIMSEDTLSWSTVSVQKRMDLNKPFIDSFPPCHHRAVYTWCSSLKVSGFMLLLLQNSAVGNSKPISIIHRAEAVKWPQKVSKERVPTVAFAAVSWDRLKRWKSNLKEGLLNLRIWKMLLFYFTITSSFCHPPKYSSLCFRTQSTQ